MRRKPSRGKALQEYAAKRDFARSREPAGAVAPSGAGSRFVVQEHHASVLHYDFRLEIDGVLKSWSVPKGPSLDPAVKRLAVQVEDHPVEYLTFTGRIPEGSYGGGQVYRWDIGTFESLDPDARAAWEKGSLKFRLTGDRLRGEWRLIRTKGMGTRRKPSWLLFKVRDAHAEPGHVAERIGADGRSSPPPRAKPRRRSASRVPRSSKRSPTPLSLAEFIALDSPSGDRVVDVQGIRVTLTHLDRVYWPHEKVTKFELLKYYIGVWPELRPFLAGRPAILHRYPGGIAGSTFVQHDLDQVPEYVTTRTLETREGRAVDYAVYGPLATLLYLTNIGTLEHHPWHSTVEHLDRPDWLALDLDPGTGSWEDVLRLALVVRDVFEKRKLRGYPKTSGSRGMHIYLPLELRFSYTTVSDFARALAQEVVDRAPRLATLERMKAARRQEQIYVDWLQNARGKTMAAPYTVRARPGAPISMPLSWTDVEKGVRIQDFSVRTPPASAGAWRDFFAQRQKLPRGD